MAEVAVPSSSCAMPVRKQTLSIPIFMGLFALVVLLTANAYWMTAITAAVALSLSVTGISILYGQLGLVSLCQFALVGVGGWVTLRLGHGWHLPFEVSLLSGGVVASVIGLAFGIPALRLRGLYLALVTLMIAGGFQTVISAWGFPDGGPGFFGRAEGAARMMLPKPALAQSSSAYFLYVCVVAALCLSIAHWHRHSRPGRAWALIRKGPAVATAAGVNILLFKAWAFALSGFLAGIAGGLLAGNVGQLDGRAFSAFESLNLFALSIVGGVYHWYGALVAGFLLRAVPALLTDLGIDGYIAIGIFSIALFHALATAPAGIAGQIALLLTWLRELLCRAFRRQGRPS